MSTTESTMRLAEVKPSEIVTHPRNPRRLIEVADLVASVKSDGVLEPLIVAPWPESLSGTAAERKKHLLIAGHRRLAAAKAAKLRSVPVIVRDDLDTEDKQLEAMLVENVHRSDLSAVEEGQAYQQLLEFPGFTQARLAADLGLPKTRIRDRVKITKLPAGVQDRVHDGQISVTEAIDAATFADDPDVMAELEKHAGTHNFAVTLRNAQALRKSEQEYKATVKQIRDAGVTVLDERPGHTSRVENLPGVGYDQRLYYGLAKEKWAAENKVHADCPGRAVFIDDATNTLTFACITPEAHSHQGRRGVEDTDLPETEEAKAAREEAEAEREAERARQAELQTTLDAAGDVRAEHIAAILNHPTGDEDLARRVLARWLLADENEQSLRLGIYGRDWKVTAKLLGLNPNDYDPDDFDARAVVDQRRYDATKKLDKLSLPALAILAGIAAWLADGEVDLRAGIAPLTDPWQIEWVRILTDDLAYTWSDFEKDHFGLTPDGHVPKPEGGDER